MPVRSVPTALVWFASIPVGAGLWIGLLLYRLSREQ